MGNLQGSAASKSSWAPTLDTQIDSVVADAEFLLRWRPASRQLDDSSAGTAVLNLAGNIKPRKVLSRRGMASFVWDQGTGVWMQACSLQTQTSRTQLQIVGQQQRF